MSISFVYLEKASHKRIPVWECCLVKLYYAVCSINNNNNTTFILLNEVQIYKGAGLKILYYV